MKSIKTYLLNEDSLDDFDIDGSIAKKRASVSDATKAKVNKLLHKYYDNIYKVCDEFFKEKGLNLKQSEYHNSKSYLVYYPDLLWGFIYSPDNYIHYEICVGGYGHIDGVEKNDTKSFLKELGNTIQEKVKGLTFETSSVYETSLGSIYDACWKFNVGAKLKDLK